MSRCPDEGAHRGSGNNALRLLVAESRNARVHLGADADDAPVIRQLRTAGSIDRGMHVHNVAGQRAVVVGGRSGGP
jgi:hypothetical protein